MSFSRTHVKQYLKHPKRTSTQTTFFLILDVYYNTPMDTIDTLKSKYIIDLERKLAQCRRDASNNTHTSEPPPVPPPPPGRPPAPPPGPPGPPPGRPPASLPGPVKSTRIKMKDVAKQQVAPEQASLVEQVKSRQRCKAAGNNYCPRDNQCRPPCALSEYYNNKTCKCQSSTEKVRERKKEPASQDSKVRDGVGTRVLRRSKASPDSKLQDGKNKVTSDAATPWGPTTKPRKPRVLLNSVHQM